MVGGVVPPQTLSRDWYYVGPRAPRSGIARVYCESNKRFSFVDPSNGGALVIPLKFKEASNFGLGDWSIVQSENNKWGLVDSKGETLLSSTYQSVMIRPYLVDPQVDTQEFWLTSESGGKISHHKFYRNRLNRQNSVLKLIKHEDSARSLTRPLAKLLWGPEKEFAEEFDSAFRIACNSFETGQREASTRILHL